MPFEVQKQVDLPEGVLLGATLKSLEAVSVPYTDKKTGEAKSFDKLNWLFEVVEQGDYHGKTVRAETNTYISDSPLNQFGNFVRALLNRDLTPGQVLDESDLIGLPCLIQVKYEVDRSDATKKYPRVGEVFPADPSVMEPPF